MAAATNTPMPKYDWKYEASATGLQLTITPTDAPKKVRIWKTTAETKDFRKSKWESEELTSNKAIWTYTLAAPESGYAAFFAELEYDNLAFPTYLSTTLRILPPAEVKPVEKK